MKNFFLTFRSLHEMMIAPSENLSCRVYNVAAMSFTPDVLYKAVQKHVPNLEIKYNVDDRQKIGETISKKRAFEWCLIYWSICDFSWFLAWSFWWQSSKRWLGLEASCWFGSISWRDDHELETYLQKGIIDKLASWRVNCVNWYQFTFVVFIV